MLVVNSKLHVKGVRLGAYLAVRSLGGDLSSMAPDEEQVRGLRRWAPLADRSTTRASDLTLWLSDNEPSRERERARTVSRQERDKETRDRWRGERERVRSKP